MTEHPLPMGSLVKVDGRDTVVSRAYFKGGKAYAVTWSPKRRFVLGPNGWTSTGRRQSELRTQLDHAWYCIARDADALMLRSELLFRRLRGCDTQQLLKHERKVVRLSRSFTRAVTLVRKLRDDLDKIVEKDPK